MANYTKYIADIHVDAPKGSNAVGRVTLLRKINVDRDVHGNNTTPIALKYLRSLYPGAFIQLTVINDLVCYTL